MCRIFLVCLCLFIVSISCEEDKKYKQIFLEEGPIAGEKYWNGDFYEFYGVPYASVPKGRDRFKGPIPLEKRDAPLIANEKRIMCHQTYYSEDPDDVILAGEEDCLLMNFLVPEIANKENPVPVVVYIHSGAFGGGHGNMAKYHFLARRDILVVSFNYRLGAIGFACLGTEDIPGNAGMKDQVYALKWIQKNIIEFGGDPNKVTLAGFSVGSAMAELLALSKTTDGLIHQLILESGSALSPYSINRDPIGTTTNLARAMGYNGTTIQELTDFYINATPEVLVSKSLNFFLTNSTFGYAPCIENVHKDVEPFLTEDPLKILKEGNYKKIPILTGFASHEGLSRTLKFDLWHPEMNEDLTKFLPADLKFDNTKSKDEFIKKVREFYFKNEKITNVNFQGYVDFFSDSMFKYSILKSAKLHASAGRPVYFYEFSFVGTLSTKHRFMDTLRGASHRDQSAYVLDFFAFTNDINDLNIRDRMTWMWSDFVKFGDPTAYESELVNYKWLKFSDKEQNYLHIDIETEMKKEISTKEYNFWNEVYEKYYWTPKAPSPKK